MDFKELAAARYSLRKFDTDRAVEQEKLDLILTAGRIAPTAHNKQPQRIFVVRSKESMEKLEPALFFHYKPNMYLVVGYDPEEAWKRTEVEGKNHGEIDAAIASDEMMLQAADIGLGTVYIGVFDPEKVKAAFPEATKGLELIAVLALGYPAEGAHPAKLHTLKKPAEEIVKEL